ncbi:hypothetical protein [Lactobacillus hominis]|nr:hypothetical protein [Lactobacillus hominis]
MIKEIMTSEGIFKKSLAGKKVEMLGSYVYIQPEQSYADDDRLYVPNEFPNAQFEIAFELGDFYLLKITRYRDWYYWAEKADVKILGGVKSAFIKLLHRFSLRGAVC